MGTRLQATIRVLSLAASLLTGCSSPPVAPTEELDPEWTAYVKTFEDAIAKGVAAREHARRTGVLQPLDAATDTLCDLSFECHEDSLVSLSASIELGRCWAALGERDAAISEWQSVIETLDMVLMDPELELPPAIRKQCTDLRALTQQEVQDLQRP